MSQIAAHKQYVGKDGAQYPGVTTILGILNKPALVIWANKLGLQGIDSTKYKDKMADIGTLAHWMIIDHLLSRETETDQYSKEDIDKAENCFLAYLDWEKQHKIRPVLVEMPFVSEEYLYGGTPDFLGYVDDKLEIIDFKTGNNIYPEYFYQLAAYCQLAKEADQQILQARIIRIDRDGRGQVEERILKNLQLEFELFLHCLAIYNLQKELKYR